MCQYAANASIAQGQAVIVAIADQAFDDAVQ
jgi:hypothetical protein